LIRKVTIAALEPTRFRRFLRFAFAQASESTQSPRVLATASGEDGAALVRRLGADAAIDGGRDDSAAAARDFAPDSVDAVLVLAAGDPLERCLDALRSGGRLAYPHGVEPEPKKRYGIAIIAYDAIAGVAEFEHLNGAVEEAKLQVPIAAGIRARQRRESA
jgi:NADPH:quinone reductase-like Zn-dependent oxidoreductase